MTTATITTEWKEEWQEFYNDAIKKTQNYGESPSEEIIKNRRIAMLNYTHENIDQILNKLGEFHGVFPHLSEAWHILNLFFDGKSEESNFQSLNFDMAINEHIQIVMEPLDSIDAEMKVECFVIYNDDCISFTITEGCPEELNITLNELKPQS